MKLKKVLLATMLLSASMSMPTMAGTWQTGTGADQGKWWYDNGNGSYANNGWQWIDGNGDGIAESYYFDNNGWLLTNTTTPDGYTVNADGAWVENNVVQVKTVNENENGDNDSLQLKDGLYYYDHADIYDTKSGNLVLVGQNYKEDENGDNYDDVITELFQYGRQGDPWLWYYIENVDADTLTSIPEWSEMDNYSTMYAEEWMYKDTYKKIGERWFYRGYNSDTNYWIIEDSETLKTIRVHEKLDRETSEPTGEVYTEVITYKRVQ